MEVRGRRTQSNDEVYGVAAIARPGETATLQARNKQDPKNGAFVFSIALDKGR